MRYGRRTALNAFRTASTSLNGRFSVCFAMSSGTPGEFGMPSVSKTGAGFDQQRVGVAVIAAGELDHDVASGEAARETNRRHGRLGAGVDHAHLLDARHHRFDFLRHRHFDLRSARRTPAIARPVRRWPRAPSDVRDRESSGPTRRRSRCSCVPSTSIELGARADLKNSGVPPTPRNARTGELTPPGMLASARRISSSDLAYLETMLYLRRV